MSVRSAIAEGNAMGRTSDPMDRLCDREEREALAEIFVISHEARREVSRLDWLYVGARTMFHIFSPGARPVALRSVLS